MDRGILLQGRYNSGRLWSGSHTGCEYTIDATLDTDIHGIWGTDYAIMDEVHIHLQSLVGLQISSVFVG